MIKHKLSLIMILSFIMNPILSQDDFSDESLDGQAQEGVITVSIDPKLPKKLRSIIPSLKSD